jgi:hypothetical protein
MERGGLAGPCVLQAHLPSAALLHQSHHTHMVAHLRPCSLGCLGQCQCQAGIFKLAIPITHTGHCAGQHRGDRIHALLADDFCGAQTQTASHPLVKLEAHSGHGPRHPTPFVHHKGQGLRQMRCQAQHNGPLAQRLAHQPNVTLRQITHTPMQKLGRA